jgi:hypothetical protein
MKTKEMAVRSVCSVDHDVANKPYDIAVCDRIYSMCSLRKHGILCRK